MNHLDPSWRMCGTEGSHGIIAHANLPSKLQLEPGLEELGIAFEVESIQTANAIGGLEAQVVRQVPIDHRCEPFELASGDQLAVQVDVGKVRDQLHSAGAPGEHRPLGYHLSEGALDGVVSARLSSNAPRSNEVAAVDGRIVSRG
jgi:hypothetical protein